MTVETDLARFATGLTAGDVPPATRQVLRHMLMAVAGTAFAGAQEDGVLALRSLLLEAGGAAEAGTLVFGDRVPASVAAQFNGTVCRALDYCDAMAPGPHIGSALFPSALAAAELSGGCSGEAFLTALAVGAEISAWLNLSEQQYDGFDPTGVPVVFGATAAAARLLELGEGQMLHAMALAFNRCGGSFQSHVDGSLGGRILQGWVAQAAVQCAQLAQRGITGPVNYLAGHYGYAHLFGRDSMDLPQITAGLGAEWRLHQMVFKKYPSCGVTQGVTELALSLVAEGLKPEQIKSVQVRLPPYAHRLVGGAFVPGANPRVDAQFSAAYCVANAIGRQTSTLENFSPRQVGDPAIAKLIRKIDVIADAALDARGHAAVDLVIDTHDDRVFCRKLDAPPGYPGAPLTDRQHLLRFYDCMAYSRKRPGDSQIASLLTSINQLEQLDDIRSLAQLLVCGEHS